MVPFTVQVTRGILRDERSRRKTMGFSLLITVVMLVAGLTVLRPWLNPHEHPWRFLFFWSFARGNSTGLVAGVCWIFFSFERKGAQRGEL